MRALLKWLGVSLLLLLLAVGVLIALSWAPDLPLAQLKARWAPAPSQFIELQGMSVHLRDEGPRDDPIPLLLLHGTSASLHTWDGWAQALTERRRVCNTYICNISYIPTCRPSINSNICISIAIQRDYISWQWCWRWCSG